MGTHTQAAAEPSDTITLGISFLAFVGLGMGDLVLGVLWPAIRPVFGAPIETLGLILAAGTAGFFLTSLNSGRLITALGVRWFVLIGLLLRVAGFAMVALAPNLGGLYAAMFLNGAGASAVDTGLNTFVATRYRAGQLNWLHANFGLGATLGPMVATVIVANGLPWQLMFWVLVGFHLLMAGVFLLTPGRWSLPAAAETDDARQPAALLRETARLPLVWVSVVLFFTYTGLEWTAGQWAATLLNEGRGVPLAVAGQWVSIYWAAFTVGRVVAGVVADSAPLMRLLRGTIALAIVAAALIWWNPSNLVSFVGLALLGLALAPVFPMLMAVTPQRVGQRHTPNLVGFQFGSASLGGAALPWLAGVLAAAFSLEVIGGLLVLWGVVLFVLSEVAARVAAHRLAAASTPA